MTPPFTISFSSRAISRWTALVRDGHNVRFEGKSDNGNGHVKFPLTSLSRYLDGEDAGTRDFSGA